MLYILTGCVWDEFQLDTYKVYDGADVVRREHGGNVIAFINKCFQEDVVYARCLGAEKIEVRPITEADRLDMIP